MKLALVVVSVLALAGCKKSEAPAAKGSASGSAEVVASPPTPAPTVPATGSGSDEGSAEADAPPVDVRPAIVTDEILKTVDQTMTALDKLATDLEAAKGDCNKALAVVHGQGKAAAALAKRIEAARATTDADPQAQAYIGKYMRPKMSVTVGKLMSVAMACQDVSIALQKHPLLERKKAPTTSGSGSAAPTGAAK